MNPKVELEKIIDRLPLERLKLLLAYAKELEVISPEEFAEIEAGKDEIAQGDWKDWDDLKTELNL